MVDAAAAFKLASATMEGELEKHGLKSPGLCVNAAEKIQGIVKALPIGKMAELPQALCDLAGALQNAAANPASSVRSGSCFAGCASAAARKVDAELRELKQKCSDLAQSLSQAHATVEKSSGELVQGLTKLTCAASEKVQQFQSVPGELVRLGDAVAACHLDEIDLGKLQNIADISQVQESIWAACNLKQQVRDSMVDLLNEVLQKVLEIANSGPARLLDAGAVGFPFQCLSGLLPGAKFSESATVLLKKFSEVKELACQIQAEIKNLTFPDDTEILAFESAVGDFSASLQHQLDQLDSTVKIMEAAANVTQSGKSLNPILAAGKNLLNPVLAAGKKKRGALETDQYKFGDFTRGILGTAECHKRNPDVSKQS